MDMFDLFRESDEKNDPEAPQQDSPPIPSSQNEESDADHSPLLDSFSPPTSTLAPSAKTPLANAVVLCIPGMLIFKKHAFQLSWLTQLSHSVEQLREKGHSVALVIGESHDIRSAAHAARQLGVSSMDIEDATRASSHLYASLVLRLLAQAHPSVCHSLDETVSLLHQGKVPVMLGSKDTVSTEARAAMLAENLSAKYVLFTDLDIPTNTITHSRFSRMAGDAAFKNNQSFIVDPLTAMILHRSRVESFLLPERTVGKLVDVLVNPSEIGTFISTPEKKFPSLEEKDVPSDSEKEE
ncbi:MAG: hypothetical protein V1776_01175 [Candidatus Diapherotrites archaeon]